MQFRTGFANHCREFTLNETSLHRTPLYDQHVKLGAKLVPFAGYEMPVQYPAGILAEHNWTRTHAGLFDVSHMGQCALIGPDFATTAKFMETLVPADILGLAPGQQRYSQLMAENGGILDDLMMTRSADSLYIVVNAGRKNEDFAHIQKHLLEGINLKRLDNLALLALQGPSAVSVLMKRDSTARDLEFMFSTRLSLNGIAAHVSRSGYTGEDGFEISVGREDAAALWQLLLDDAEVKPVGLGARDSLRLEAGLCLYGHDIDETTSPVEAGLLWSIQKRRRLEGGFPGAKRVLKEIADGPARKRVGFRPEGRAPAREGTLITDASGRSIGTITSGGFGPTLGGPLAMGYVEAASAKAGTEIRLVVRGASLPAKIVTLPFIPHKYKR